MIQDDSHDREELRFWESMRNGDKSALAWLYNRYFRLLYNYGRKIGVENQALEDGIHDLFVDLWRFRRNLSSTTSVRFYLYRSLRRRVLRNETGKKFLEGPGFVISDLLDVEPSSEQVMIEEEANDERLRRLKKLLNDLSPRQYEALVLRFYDEFSYEEIASILEMNEQSARNLVQRGLMQLRQYFRHVISLLFFLSFL